MDKILLKRSDLLMYGKIAQYRVGYVAGQIEITSICEQKCLYCDSWKSHQKGTIKGTLSYKTLSNLINQLNAMPTFEHLSMTGGDPQDWCDPENPDMDFESLLLILGLQGLNFSLQVNTALIKPINYSLWRESLNRVRVSLDGITRETYKKMRGDDRDPEEIIKRMDNLAHPGLSTLTCVTSENIEEVFNIIMRLNKMKNPPRKAMFLAVLGTKLDKEFWKEYKRLKLIHSPRVETSFQEDIVSVRKFCNSPEAEQLFCAVGGITFHIKCNGDVYPCCLCGGEAIKTQEHMRIGNILDETISSIQKRYRPVCWYKKDTICSDICQWKQLQINRLAQEASKTILTMP